MSMLDMRTAAEFLRMVGVTAADNPDEFDRLGRELCQWWSDGGSCREWVRLHQAAEARNMPEPKRLTWAEALSELRARYVPPG